MNIPEDILTMADKINQPELEPILVCAATGGGCDYIIRHFNDGVVGVIVDSDGLDSPDSLKDPCTIEYFGDENWLEKVAVSYFNTTEEAMDYLANLHCDFPKPKMIPFEISEKELQTLYHILMRSEFPDFTNEDQRKEECNVCDKIEALYHKSNIYVHDNEYIFKNQGG